MKVLHLMSRMAPSGTEHQLAGMLRAAHGKLWDATLCVLQEGHALTAELGSEGIPIIEIEPAASKRHDRRALKVRKLLSSGEYDVVHSSLWGGNVFTRTVVATLPRRPGVVISERRVEDFRKPYQRLIDAGLRRVTDQYIGNSDAVGEFIVRAHGVPSSQVTVIPNGIDVEVFYSKAKSKNSGAAFRVGGLGRLVEQKGFDVLIDAIPKVLASVNAQFMIAGQGPLLAELEKRAKGLPVEFVGFLNKPVEVAEYLQSLDLFVLPSRFEGLPNAVLEALACGTPAVVSDGPGIVEATQGLAAVVPVEDSDALADAIVASASSEEVAPTPKIATFMDVARSHLEVFEKALTRS